MRELSDAPDRASGGALGLRTADRYPPVFIEATQKLAVGDISALVRSGAGFHILKVLEKRSAAMPATTAVQNRARHILLNVSPQRSEAAAREQLKEFRQRIVAGQADFAALARQHSQDASAAQGGDLGWASAGMFVPEFEEAMNRLAPGEISEPLVSRFGVHLIQLTEFKKRIMAGKADFAALARDNSQDGSAAQGGDLGWASAGMFVPEFEEVMNRLAPGEISEPLVSRFGVHLIQLTERRNTTLSPREQRETVRAMLREKKLDDAFLSWAQDLRGRAYVEMREPPQ